MLVARCRAARLAMEEAPDEVSERVFDASADPLGGAVSGVPESCSDAVPVALALRLCGRLRLLLERLGNVFDLGLVLRGCHGSLLLAVGVDHIELPAPRLV